MRRLGWALLVAAGFCVVAGVASASSLIFDDFVSTCTGINCSSLRIPGTVLSFPPTAGYFEIGAFASAGQCLRLEVFSEAADLEMVVRAPNGTLYRNDDKGGTVCPLCPRVVVNNTPVNGWYSVTLAHFAGSGVNANFVLYYGRYPPGNPNCFPASPGFSPSGAEDKELKAPDDSVEPPHPGHPGS